MMLLTTSLFILPYCKGTHHTQLAANTDSVLDSAVKAFAREMADLKGMCEEELEKTQQMLSGLAQTMQ